MRENLVMRHHQRLHRLGLVMGHGGYVVGILEYGVTDIVWLRIWAIVGCGMVVAYQLLQPRVQWLSAGWCGVYVAVNVFQLLSLLGAAPPALSWEEANLHERYAKHITAGQFGALLALGEWLWLVDGAILAEQGCDAAEKRLTFITEGTCEVCVDGRTVAELGPGTAVGEVGVLKDAKASGATVRASGSVRCFSVPASRVLERLEAQPELRRPLERVFAGTLAAKVVAMSEQLQARNYKAVLEVACTLDRHEAMSTAVGEYRRRHGVSGELHRRLLEELPQCVHKPFQLPVA